MYFLRRWAVHHAGFFEKVWKVTESTIIRLAPIADRIGHDRLEKPVAAFEKVTKGLLFDCHMCGQCVLSSTGMSCPMNCPKTIRNGPCGGVRPDGYCEGWKGAQKMQGGEQIATVQFAVDYQLKGKSSWFRHLRKAQAEQAAAHEAEAAAAASGAAVEPRSADTRAYATHSGAGIALGTAIAQPTDENAQKIALDSASKESAS